MACGAGDNAAPPARPPNEPHVEFVRVGPLAGGALARVDDDPARAHARQHDHLLRQGRLPRGCGHLAVGQRRDLRGITKPCLSHAGLSSGSGSPAIAPLYVSKRSLVCRTGLVAEKDMVVLSPHSEGHACSTCCAHCKRMARRCKHGDHQVEGAVAAVEGGVLEEQRREARLTSYQPLLAVAAQPLVTQPDAPATCVAQRARRDNDEHGRLADGARRVV